MIAIKNFNMPKDCDSCPFYQYHNDSDDTCSITGEGLNYVNFGEYHEKCPLVNIDIDDMYQPYDYVEDFDKGYNRALSDINEKLG